MVDLHSHVCFGIDDGSKTLKDSIELLKCLESSNFTDIFLTPHYIENSKYICNNIDKESILNTLKEEAKKNNINVNLYLGNEVYLTDNFLELLKNNQIHTLANSKYILLEFPMLSNNPNTKIILHNILTSGYIPIIAHPERYLYLSKNIEYFKELSNMGVLFQGNYQSLFGKYGREVKKNLKRLLKNNLITFIGSDIHHIEDMHADKIYKEIKKCVKSDEKVYAILEGNAKTMILNEK